MFPTRNNSLSALVCAFGLCLTGAQGQIFGVNLIANPGAESGAGSASGNDILPVPSWSTSGSLTAIQYAAGNGYPTPTDPGPSSRGANFFAGGPGGATSVATQVIDLTSYTAPIDAGSLTFELSGYFGGFDGQEDNALLTASFRDGSGSPISAVSVGGVSPAERGNATGLLFRNLVGVVPIGTREALLTLTMTRLEGFSNDGYADNLSLTVVPEPAVAVTLTSISLAGLVALQLRKRGAGTLTK